MSDSTQLIRRKGVCKNPDCDLCMSREVQEIEPGEDFICSDCGAPLQEVGDKGPVGPGGGGPNRTLMLAIICAVVAILCGVGYWFFVANSSSDEPNTTGSDSTEIVTNPVQEGPVTDTGGGSNDDDTRPGGDGTTITPPTSGTVSLGNGSYTGPLKGGKPDGIGGTFTCSRAFTLDLKDGYGNTVDIAAGDKIIDTKFDNGKLQQGEIHFADGTRKYVSGLNAAL